MNEEKVEETPAEKPIDVLFNEWLKVHNLTFTIVSVAPKTKAQVDLSEWLPAGWGVLLGFSKVEK